MTNDTKQVNALITKAFFDAELSQCEIEANADTLLNFVSRSDMPKDEKKQALRAITVLRWASEDS